MRDAAGEPADDLHLARLPQLIVALAQRRFQVSLLGDVGGHDRGLGGLALEQLAPARRDDASGR